MHIRWSQIFALFVGVSLASPARAGLRSVFAYRLSDPNGELDLSWSSMSWDPVAGELYVVDRGTVDIFNDAGMQVFTFGDDAALGTVLDVAALPDGQLFALTLQGRSWALVRCNFRGEPQAKIEIPDLPFDKFSPGTLRFANGTLYLADKGRLRVLAVGVDGAVRHSWDLHKLMGLDKKHFNGNDMRGFNVDRDGNLLGTIPGLFLAFVVSPEGAVRTFGTRGSSPGKFNIAAGIASDDEGRLYVTDTLKCAVLIFDKDGKFIDQFGYRGDDDGEGLMAPLDIAVVEGRVFVSQSRGGIKAFDVLLD